MVKDIIALVEDNMDMETVPKRKGFLMFSEYVREELRN